MAETFDLGRAIIGRYGEQEYLGARVGRSGDESLVGIGVPSLLMTVSEQPATGGATGAASVIGGRSGGLGWWWHTPDDTLDKLDPALLARDARLYAATIFRLCAEPLLPFDYATAVRELDRFVAEYQDLVGQRFDLSLARAQTQALLHDATELQNELEAMRMAMATSTSKSSDLALINRAIMALGRATIPLNYTAAGPFGHDPALGVPPLPLLAPARHLAATALGSDDERFVAVTLRRNLNQVVHALDGALEACARARETLK